MDEKKILDMCARYRRLYSAGVYDVMDEMGHPHQCLSLEIRPLESDWVVAGPAFTIKWTAETRHLTEDLIVGGKMEYRDGALPVPQGPGLGVEVDEEKLREGARRYEVEGGMGFPLDPKRPLWYQKFPAW